MAPDQRARTGVRGRLTALFVALGLFAALIVGRAAFVQLRPDSRLEAMARKQFESRVLIRPPRGTISDRNGEPLAINVETGSLAANPRKIINRRNLARVLAKATDVPYPRLLARLSETREFVWIKRHMTENDLKKLKSWHVMDPGGELAAGLWLVKESKRVYPHGELAAHAIGDVNVDSEGLEGVELWRNETLRGKVVSVQAVRDALGRPTFIDAVAAKHVQDGEPLTLTLDNSLQYSVEEELRAAIHRTGARSGTVMVMNAMTGELLALANAPTFNPNLSSGPPEFRRNRALTDGYEPGSTIKPILIASALSHGAKLSDQVWGEKGSFYVQGKRISEAEAHEKFEWLSLREILKVSSNVGAAKVALKLGPDRYLEALKAFGIGSRSELGFPGEIAGYVPPRKAWSQLTTANVGFGQGLLVTPLQMLRAYAVFINGGWLVQPSLIKSEGPRKVAPRRAISARVAEQVVQAMEGVTTPGGTAVKAALPGYRVAGKTGTAQVVDPVTHLYSRSRYIASFVGFAVGVDPRIVIYTALDEPKGIYYGSETAAPLFREVLNAVASRFGLPAAVSPPALIAATRTDRITQSQARSVPVPRPSPSDPAAGTIRWLGAATDGTPIWRMPRLKGLTPREALRALQGHRFQIEVQGEGLVHTQQPDDGKSIAEGEKVRLVLAEP